MRSGNIFRDGSIPYQRFRGGEIAGRTAGLVGLGAVGRATQWRLSGLGLRVIAHDPYNPDARHSLDELLAEADIVSLHAPVTDDTAGMIGAGQFAAMRDGVVFLNTARAQLHDTDALVDALVAGKVAATRPGSLRRRMAAGRPSARGDGKRRADPAHRRRDLEHRGPAGADGGRRPRGAAEG